MRRPCGGQPKIKLRLLWLRFWWWFEKFRDRPPVHQIGPDEPGEGERAHNDFVGLMGEAQQQESDQCDSDLDTHGIFGGSEEVSDLQGLLDPAEEQLDGPPALVEVGEFLRGRSDIRLKEAKHLAGNETGMHLVNKKR